MNEENLNEIFTNYFTKEKLKHAYFFNTNNLEEALEKIIIIGLKINERSFGNININKVKNGEDKDIKIIKTDKQEISKGEILELQNEYSYTSQEGNKRIYIIFEASKLNRSSANTMLKFLEEPPENVIAFLVDINPYMMISTILSRCILINLNFKGKIKKVSDETVNFLNILTVKKSKFIAYLSNSNREFFADKKNLMLVIEESLMIYKNLLDEKFNISLKTDIINDVNIDFTEETKESIIVKIKAFLKCLEYSKYNVNSKTILDKMNFLIYGGSDD